MTRGLSEPMTIEQLKKHMDRRLRMKADKADVRRPERRMDQPFGEVDARFGEIDARFGEVMRQFEGLRQQLNGIASGIWNSLEKHERLVDEYQGRLTDRDFGST
jgi:hypothetical protein